MFVLKAILKVIMPLDNEYVGDFCIDRKIELPSYIKRWGGNKDRQTDSHVKKLEEMKLDCSDDVCNELRAAELSIQQTEHYEMLRLAVSQEGKNCKSYPSVMNILPESTAYKSLEEKVAKKKEKVENDENENKNATSKFDRGKTIEKSSPDSGTEAWSCISDSCRVSYKQKHASTDSAPLSTTSH